MKRFFAWLAARKARSNEARWRKGYDSATKWLTSGRYTAREIRAHTEDSRFYGEFDFFDAGALHACALWESGVLS